jgi:succinate dehydrogenase/fumarate reductase cytochrome b subunit
MVDTEKLGDAIEQFSRPSAPSTPPTLTSHRVTIALGVYLLAVVAVLFYSLITLWVQADAKGLYTVDFAFMQPVTMSVDTYHLLIVALMGAMGSFVHAATSFADYVGNRRLNPAWAWWYLLRPCIGSALAIVLYFVVRGGLLQAGASGSAISIYGIAAVAALSGMFSKHASDKLDEVFKTMFRTAPDKGDVLRRDKLSGPAVARLDPSSVVAASAPVVVAITGQSFVAESIARVNGAPRPTDFVSPTQLRVTLAADDTKNPGSLIVTVANPDGSLSHPAVLEVRPA